MILVLSKCNTTFYKAFILAWMLSLNALCTPTSQDLMLTLTYWWTYLRRSKVLVNPWLTQNDTFYLTSIPLASKLGYFSGYFLWTLSAHSNSLTSIWHWPAYGLDFFRRSNCFINPTWNVSLNVMNASEKLVYMDWWSLNTINTPKSLHLSLPFTLTYFGTSFDCQKCWSTQIDHLLNINITNLHWHLHWTFSTPRSPDNIFTLTLT